MCHYRLQNKLGYKKKRKGNERRLIGDISLNFPEGTDEITKYLNKDSLSGMEI
jgi:hypothetical protein